MNPSERMRAAIHATRLLPSPRTSDTNGAGHHGDGGMDLRTAVSLLPTPAVNDMGEGKTVEAWDAWTERMKAEHGNGNGHGASLSIEAQRLLLPTPTTRDHKDHTIRREPHRPDSVDTLSRALTQWGQYAAAIARWEFLTRPAPAPTEAGPKGNPRLSAAFSEWMMGLPAGWVTDVPGITRNEALRALGNGVVPQQGAAALAEMLAWTVAA
jgi:DNA (cytosine-5)-methyltransferase 1